MAHRSNNNTFLTPDRKPAPDTASKGFSTTAARGIFKKLGSNDSPQYQRTEINEGVYENESSINEKLNWFQARTTQLRVYLNQCPKIDKRKIRDIFDWNEKAGTEPSEQRKLLKQLGQKVRGLIKENSKLKHTIYNGEITDLRIENQRLKYMLENIQKGEEARSKIIIEENQIMKNYIDKQCFKKEDDSIYKKYGFSQQEKYHNFEEKQIEEIQQVQQAEEDEQKQPLFNSTLLSLDRLKNLKEYFTMYVNTVIQENDQKFHSQQKYIDCLEKRIVQLEQIDKKLQHFRFEKKVRLQQSERKGKNYTANAPVVYGDVSQKEESTSQIEQRESEGIKRPKVVLPVNYYRKKQRIVQNLNWDQDLEEQLQRLRSQNILLRQNLQNLQQKYEVEIQKHIRDISQKQKLLLEIEKLAQQNKLLLAKSEFKSQL